MNRQRIYILRTPLDFWIICFVLWCGIEVFFSHYPLQSFRGALWYICNAFLPFYLCMNFTPFRQKPYFWIRRFVYFGGLICGIALLQTGYDGFVYGRWKRMGGPLEDSAWFSVFCLCILPLAWTLLWSPSQAYLKRSKVYLGSISLIGLAFLGTGSRLGFISFCLFLVLKSNTLTSNRWFKWGGCGVIFCTILLFSLGGDRRFMPSVSYQAAQHHLYHQSELVGYLSVKRMLVGVGSRTVPTHLAYAQKYKEGRYVRTPHLRNTWLTLWVEHGLIGFTLFLIILVKALRFLYT
jgi:hypothetical protein